MAAPGHLGGERRAPAPSNSGGSAGGLGGDGGQGGTQQCYIPALGTVGPTSAQWGFPAAVGGNGGHCQAVRLWADLEAPWAFWMMAVHFSRRSSLLFSKNPSLRGTPWEPSGKVRRPGEGRKGLGAKGQGAAPMGAGARTGGTEREMLGWTGLYGAGDRLHRAAWHSPKPYTRPPLNSPSKVMLSQRVKTPTPLNLPCMNSPSYLCRRSS